MVISLVDWYNQFKEVLVMKIKPLEENFIMTIWTLEGINQKIKNTVENLNVDMTQVSINQLAYSNITQTFYHAAIVQARKLFEEGNRYDLTNDEWQMVTDLRHEVAHANNKESHNIKIIAQLKDVTIILNKILKAITNLYSLDNDEYTEFIKDYLKTIQEL